MSLAAIISARAIYLLSRDLCKDFEPSTYARVSAAQDAVLALRWLCLLFVRGPQSRWLRRSRPTKHRIP